MTEKQKRDILVRYGQDLNLTATLRDIGVSMYLFNKELEADPSFMDSYSMMLDYAKTLARANVLEAMTYRGEDGRLTRTAIDASKIVLNKLVDNSKPTLLDDAIINPIEELDIKRFK